MPDNESKDNATPTLRTELQMRGRSDRILRMAWSPDGRQLAVAPRDTGIRVWDLETSAIHLVFREPAYCLAWSPTGAALASAGLSRTIWIWNTRSREDPGSLSGHTGAVVGLAWSSDGNLLISSSDDQTIRIWDVMSKQPSRVIRGARPLAPASMALAPDGNLLAIGCSDGAIQVHNVKIERGERYAEAHASRVNTIAWAPDGSGFVTGSDDQTVRLWDANTVEQRMVLEGHTGAITAAAYSSDGHFLATKSTDRTVRVWRVSSWDVVATIAEPFNDVRFAALAFNPKGPVLASLGEDNTAVRIWDLNFEALARCQPLVQSVQYVNAKVVLVGESGVGKSALGIRMAENEFRPTESTHGARFWQIPASKPIVHSPVSGNARAELTLWDLAGQPEYRLVHQLFLDNTDAALLLFDCSDPNDPFRGIAYWTKVLRKQAPNQVLKLLISSRVDVCPVTVHQRELANLLATHDLDGYLRTSAKTGEGIAELMQRLLESIPWNRLPRITTPLLFQAVRRSLLDHKENGLASLIPIDRVQKEISHKIRSVSKAEIDTVIELLQARGLVYRLNPTPKVSLVLLRPELINQYASSIIRAARDHPLGIGAVVEREVICANLSLVGTERVRTDEELILLQSTVELLIGHDLCFREMGLLVFPSQINVTKPPTSERHPPADVTYRFSGSIEAIYASLVVRLSYTEYFRREDQWKYAAEFSRKGHRMGFTMRPSGEGNGDLEIYFFPEVSVFDRVTFIRFVTDHLKSKGIDIEEHIRLFCSKCQEEIENERAIQRRVDEGYLDIPCQYCGTMVLIPRSVEERYQSSDSYPTKQRKLAKVVERRTGQEVTEFRYDREQYTADEDSNLIHILHLSDLHINPQDDSHLYLTQLETDLIKELRVNKLEYLVISGDVAADAEQEEYEKAFGLVDGLAKRFGLDPSRVVVVPGDRDINLDLSEQAYRFVPRRKLFDPLPAGTFIPAGDVGALLRDDALYVQRFASFGTHFYKRVYGGAPYPLDYREQGILQVHHSDHILFVALNSSWESDHYYTNRAAVNADALSDVLDQLQTDEYSGWLKIAVWHHAIGKAPGMTSDFLDLLAVHGFQLCLHGDVGRLGDDLYRFDQYHRLHLVGAGSFGGPKETLNQDAPYRYSLMVLDPVSSQITIETRRKASQRGAWMADAIWGDRNNPSPRHTIEIPDWIYPGPCAA